MSDRTNSLRARWHEWAFRRGFITIRRRCWFCERIYAVPRNAESVFDGWYCPRCK